MPWGVVAAGVIGAVGSNMAAGTQADAQEQAAQTQLQMFQTLNQQEQPFIQGGYGAENALLYGLGIGSAPSATASPSVPLNTLMNGGYDLSSPYALGRFSAVPQAAPGAASPVAAAAPSTAPQYSTPPGMGFGSLTSQFTPTDFLNNLDPGYQFQLQQGDLALQSANTAGGSALSGPALKSLMSFNQGLASTGYQNAFNRFTTQQNNIFSRLSAIAGMGQNAATQVGTAGTSLGTGMAQAQAAAGGSLAGGIAGATNSVGNSVQLAGLMNGGYGGSSYGGSPYVGEASPGAGAGTVDAGGGYIFSTGS